MQNCKSLCLSTPPSFWAVFLHWRMFTSCLYRRGWGQGGSCSVSMRKNWVVQQPVGINEASNSFCKGTPFLWKCKWMMVLWKAHLKLALFWRPGDELASIYALKWLLELVPKNLLTGTKERRWATGRNGRWDMERLRWRLYCIWDWALVVLSVAVQIHSYSWQEAVW